MENNGYIIDPRFRSNQPCFTCHKACGGCSWSYDFTPVKGWTATPTVKCGQSTCGGYPVDSFEITYCPEYERDKPIDPSSLQTMECFDLLGAIFREAAKEYEEALDEFEAVKKDIFRYTTHEIDMALLRYIKAEEALTPNICDKIKARREKERKKNH